MQIRVLGPVQVVDQQDALPLGGAKQRAVLAMLALRANQVVSGAALIDGLWGSDPPDTAANAVQGYVSRLRKTWTGRTGRSGWNAARPVTCSPSSPRLLDLFACSTSWRRRPARPLIRGRRWTCGGVNRWPSSPMSPSHHRGPTAAGTPTGRADRADGRRTGGRPACRGDR